MRASQDGGRRASPVSSGSLLRHRVFDEEAVYRVLQTRGRVVEVEVVTVVGLPPGTQLKLTLEAATAMRSAPAAWLVRHPQGVHSPARREVPAAPRSR